MVKSKKAVPAKKAKSKKANRRSRDEFQIEVSEVKLSKGSRKILSKVKDAMWGNVANAIECGRWFIPVENHLHSHIKSRLESSMTEFFALDKDIKVEIESFDTGIVEYGNNRS